MASDDCAVTQSAGTLDAEDLIATARRETGLHDFGEPDIEGPLHILVDSLNAEAFITPAGEVGKRLSLIRALSNRLRLNDALARHPEIERQTIARPIFVVGLPRTGTTKLHRLIASDPRMQSLPLWRLLEPVAKLAPVPGQPDPRIASAEAYVDAMRTHSPDMYAAHPMYALQPDEEVFVMELTMLANINATAFRAPSYEAWLKAQTFEPWYVWFKRLLQYIQFADGTEGRPWVLKAPHHLGFMPLLFKYFPDATVVHCHRDPATAVPSHASLALAARRGTSTRPDAHETGRYSLDYNSERMETYVRDRSALDREERFVDVSYRDIVDDADIVVEKIYRAAGVDLTSDVLAAMRAWEDRHQQHKHGAHKYSLEDFGLSPEEVADKFSDYIEKYKKFI